MATEIRKITLTEYNNLSGPAYNVEYSTDCITYSQSLDCTNLFLPAVGSFGFCTVDEDTTCIRLTSINSPCTNSVVEDLTPTTTTTTSTTTSTTTTAAPTTTSTTSTTTTTTSTTTTLAPTTTTSTTTTTAAPTTTTTTVEPTTTTTTSTTTTTTTTLAPTTTTTTAGTTTTTTAAPTTTTTTEPCVDCYVYTWENVTETEVGIGGRNCNGFDTWSFSTQPDTSGSTPCARQFSAQQISDYATQGIIFPTSASCGNSCIPTTTTTSTTTTTAAPSTDCYVIETIQSSPGQCFDCEGFFFSSTDTIITFYDDCSGSIIPAPTNISVEARYSDNSTGSTFIPQGTTGSVLIAFSDVQCAPLPECGEIASPTFMSASVVALTGSISECCL
jgi:hypothetical protein